MFCMIPYTSSVRETPAQRKARRERQAAEREERLATAVPWSDSIKWDTTLTIQASSYQLRPGRLFDVEPLAGVYPQGASSEQLALSPSGRWCYVEKLLPRGAKLETLLGKRRGSVMFDGPVALPAIHDRDHSGDWQYDPWMSLTPMEYLSLRPGTKLARGRVVVAGLGLGHQLVEVSYRRQVTSLVLVERDAELVEWIFPRLAPHLGMPVEVIVGDAHKVMPQLSADVALVDIFRGYGGNCWERDRLARHCPNIRKMWAWGAAG